MDLPTVKAAVKAWEKTFKAAHGRGPTKDDIKQDPSGIAEQYALYRRLTKTVSTTSSASSSSQPRPPSSIASTSTAATTSVAPPSRSTPRTVPASDYPTTPTPPSRRSSNNVLPPPPAPLSLPGQSGSSSQSVQKTLKRTASQAVLNSPPRSSASSSFVTPKKPRPPSSSFDAYTGPVLDPNPVNNPFAVVSPAAREVSSPFIHASSPRKLKEVLQANSLKKVRQREGAGGGGLPEITPRTRARKRLKGEEVEDTPIKDRVNGGARRKRGQGRPSDEGVGADVGAGTDGSGAMGRIPGGKRAMIEEDGGGDVEEEDEEDELGPSPMKPPVQGPSRSFTELFGDAASPAPPRPAPSRKSNGKLPREEGGRRNGDIRMFATTRPEAGKDKDKLRSEPQVDELDMLQAAQSSADVRPPPPAPNPDVSESEGVPAPPPDADFEAVLDATPSKRPAQPPPAREKVLNLSDDDELDEWDPEGGHVTRRIVITATRRTPRKRFVGSDDEFGLPSDESGAGGKADDDDAGPEEEEEGDEGIAPPPPLVGEGTTTLTATSPSSPHPSASSLAPPLLSMLSLHSPTSSRRHAKMHELRVKALFNPRDAARLKAMRKGQDVYVSGEVESADGARGQDGGVDEGLLERFEDAGRGEDGGGGEDGDGDWESEDEGWKRSAMGLGMDDEEGW